jgi:hypothetical protein
MPKMNAADLSPSHLVDEWKVKKYYVSQQRPIHPAYDLWPTSTDQRLLWSTMR